MNRTPVRALLKAIAGREGILDCIAEGLTDKRSIEDRLGISRSSVTRWIGDLQDVDVITCEAQGLQITALGKLAYQEYDRLEHRFSDLINAGPLLKHLPSDIDLDLRVLEDAEVILSDEIAPLEPFRRLEDMVRNAEMANVRGCLPIVVPRFVDFFHAQIMAGDLEAEFVLKSGLLEYLMTAYHTEFVDLVESGRGTFWSIEGSGPPYALALVGEEGIWVGVHKPGDSFRGAIINTSQSAIDWGHEQYYRLRDSAAPVDRSDMMFRGGSVPLTNDYR